MEKKIKCWEVFKCENDECPAYKAEDLKCWLTAGTHCRKEIQGKFLEKMEVCIPCKVFKANMNPAFFEETLKIVNQQIKELKAMCEEKQKELKKNHLELVEGMSKCFDMASKLAKGDPQARIKLEVTENESLYELEAILNQLAGSMEEMVEETHELAIGICEHFDALNRMAAGDHAARAPQNSKNELVARLGALINKMAERLMDERVEELKKREAALKEKVKELEEIGKSAVGREVKMMDMEREMNALLKELGRAPKY